MSRYIDAEPLDKEISSWITDDRGGNLDNDEIVFNETLVDCLEAISKQPTVDAVPVVRCRDCKHKDVIPDIYEIGIEALYCRAIKRYVEHDFFCKYGEKVME